MLTNSVSQEFGKSTMKVNFSLLPLVHKWLGVTQPLEGWNSGTVGPFLGSFFTSMSGAWTVMSA